MKTVTTSKKTVALRLNSYISKLLAIIQDTLRMAREDKSFLLMTYLARFVVVREWVGRRGKLKVSEAAAVQSTQITMTGDFTVCMNTLFADGYYTGLSLTPEKKREFLDFAFANPCYGNRNRKNVLRVTEQHLVDQKFENGPYQVADYGKNIEQCQALLDLKYDPIILSIAGGYMGREPVYYRSELLWTFPENPESETVYTLLFHSDINDYRNVKIFFYLTDVDSDCGPHSYIKGSHKRRSLLNQLRPKPVLPHQENQLVQFYGADKVTPIYGSSGSGFVGDPFCLHRGELPKKKTRLMLQIEYGSRDYDSCYSYLK